MTNAKKRLAGNIDILTKIATSKVAERRKLIKAAQDDTILTIIECAHNLLKGNVSLNAKEKARLNKHAAFLKKLNRQTKKLDTKRKLLVQHGGALPALLLPVLGIAATILGNLLSK